jgi:hypothetical protein
MQHYRLPTRLLDWSESPMIALYFCLEGQNHDSEDGTLWALDPVKLSLKQNHDGVIFSGSHNKVLPLVRGAFNRYPACPEVVLPIMTDQLDVRQMLQQSTFTIHGGTIPINKLPGSDDFLAKIRIPKELKNQMRGIVDLLGMNRSVLFPDLENLSSYLSALGFVVHGNTSNQGVNANTTQDSQGLAKP